MLFGDSGNNAVGQLLYNHGSNFMLFITNSTEQMTLTNVGRLGIRITSPDCQLHVWGATAGTVAAAAGTLLAVENSSDAFISVLVPSASVGGLVVGTPTDNDGGKFTYGSTEGSNFWNVTAGGNDVLSITSTRVVSFTTTGYVSGAGGARVAFLADNLELKGGSASIVKIESGHDLKLGVAAGTGYPPANRTLAIKDSSGTTFYLLASTSATS